MQLLTLQAQAPGGKTLSLGRVQEECSRGASHGLRVAAVCPGLGPYLPGSACEGPKQAKPRWQRWQNRRTTRPTKQAATTSKRLGKPLIERKSCQAKGPSHAQQVTGHPESTCQPIKLQRGFKTQFPRKHPSIQLAPAQSMALPQTATNTTPPNCATHQMQWWSMRSTQRPQRRQWWVRGGLYDSHLAQYLRAGTEFKAELLKIKNLRVAPAQEDYAPMQH